MAWYCHNKYKRTDLIDLNEELLKIEGELEDEEARITLAQFLRHNIGFTTELLSGIKLAGYQEVAIKAMMNRNFCLFVWGRGCAKSFIAAVFCFLQCIFYPGTKILIAGPTFRTARNIFTELDKMVKSPEAKLLYQAFYIEDPSKRADLFEWNINGGSIKAIPLNGEKIRGFRANILLLDEFLLLSKDIVNNVLKPFLTSPQNLRQRIKITELEDDLVKQGLLKEEERTQFPNETKMICLSSASYSFENLYDTYKEWMEHITNDKPVEKDIKYFISQLSYRALPEHMIDRTIIDEAANGGSSQASFQREYEAQFTDGSDSYYSARKMKECTVLEGQSPHVMLSAPDEMKCILSIDPNASNSPDADYFAMTVLWMNQEVGIDYPIHQYANAGGDLKDHQKYLFYILTHFNIELIIMDNAGGRTFIDSCNESELFKKANIKLDYLPYESDLEGNDPQKFEEMVQQAKNQYNKTARRYCIEQVFTTKFIREANEHLQAAIDYKRIWFPSSLTGHDNYETIAESTDKELVKEFTGEDEVYEWIDTQDNLVTQVKKQCALIEVKTTSLGTQSFDLPQHLKRSKSANRARKDNYTALLLALWGKKIYNELMFRPKKSVITTFMPRMFGKRV
jgi:hypothetical protein